MSKQQRWLAAVAAGVSAAAVAAGAPIVAARDHGGRGHGHGHGGHGGQGHDGRGQDGQGRRGEGHVQHVLLISVDGLHQSDLASWVAQNPGSTLAKLTRKGTTFANATTTQPSDSFPGLLSMMTGGTSKSTGVFYDDSYDRNLYAPAAQTSSSTQDCSGSPGTETLNAENLDTGAPSTANNQKGKRTILGESIDPSQLPYGKVGGRCVPIMPNDFLRTNTIFSVAHAAGLRTAWSDKHPAYQIVNGHGTPGAVNDLFTPEINADLIPNQLTDTRGDAIQFPVTNPDGSGPYILTDFVGDTESYDQIKVDGILNQIDGWNSGRTQRAGTPAIFGMNFQSVSVGQKVIDPIKSCTRSSNGPYCDPNYVPGGYGPGGHTFSPQMSGSTSYPAGASSNPAFGHGFSVPGALNYVDGALGQMVSELQSKGLMGSTEIIITAKHGQAPLDPAQLQKIGHAETQVLSANGIQAAQVTDDDVALIWLANQSQTAAAAHALSTEPGKSQAHVQTVLSGAQLAGQFGDPATDSRPPDLIVEPSAGTIYTTSTAKVAEHGGFSEPDTHVAMLVFNGAAPQHEAAHNGDPVHTTQIAPTILSALGLDPNRLDAVRAEGTQPLP